MSKIYLSKLLAINIPRKVTYQKFVGKYPATDYKTKLEIPGKFQWLHIFSDAEYAEMAFYANEYEQKDLETLKPLDRVTICKVEKKREGKPSYFNYVFAAEGDAMESVIYSPPQMTPTQERKLEATVDAQAVKSAAISLQGYSQQIIPALLEHSRYDEKLGGSMAKLIEDAFNLAELAYKENLKRAQAIVESL